MMTFRMTKWCCLWSCLILALMTGAGLSSAKAGDTDAFHAAVGSAYGHFRESAFYARRGNAMTAAIELETFVDKWRAVEATYAAKPPAAYAKDREWRQTLARIGKRAQSGLKLIDDGETKKARAMVMPIRSLLSELRRRNKMVTFSDCVDEANAAFKKLFHFRRNLPDFGNAAQIEDLKSRLKTTIDAYKTCHDKAPPKVAVDPQFQRLMKDSLYYLDRMWIAIREKNQLNVVNILRRVVSSDDILWLRFG